VVSGIDTGAMHASTNQFKKVADMIRGLGDIDFDNFGAFGEALEKIGKDGVDKFIKAFDNAKNRVSAEGKKLITNIINGAKSNTAGLTNAFRSVINSAISSIRGMYYSFYNAGSYLVTGFANGISANTYKAEGKAAAMANAARRAAERTLAINSPSKVFYKIGAFTSMGFINALSDYNSKVYNASSNMADTARTGFGDAISRINDVLDGNMDVQPTIRPVLDLSDIRTGAGTISNLLSNRASVGVLANVGSINATMNRRSQNGTNSDVVAAIGKLRREMRDYDRTVNNINGVTYDDGSGLADAVRTIVRVAKVDRRR
jgi:hypothetical protein